MRPDDVHECVEIVRAHPLLGPQYGSGIKDLRSVWLSLLGREAFRAVVFEDAKVSHVRTVGVGVSIFVSDAFFCDLKTPPLMWIGPEVTKRILCGNSPLLSDNQVRQANVRGGLNLLTWVGAFNADHLQSTEGLSAMIAAFVDEHRGFLLREIIAHAMTLENLEGAIRSGGLFFNPVDGHYVESLHMSLHEVFASPHVVGLTRELALARVGTWIGTLFVYQPPQFGFRPSEQRLLLAALQGGTDDDLARELGISLSGVKKTWGSIYGRVRLRSPGLIPDHVPAELTSERGKEKKQRLLAYVREHPEELRPASL
jgi:DNA-binding CsgD family transcriptional regulator